MAALLANVGPGDEVIMPSFTFVSTANAFVLRGATPVFVDVRNDTWNLDESLVEDAITQRTKAIVAVHYAGVPCDMFALKAIADRHGLILIEDAAQALGSHYKGQPAGAIGHLGALSFHETKNVISGEGGALIVGEASLTDRAEIIREKGTNRSAFFRGFVDKYTWIDVGSSYLPSELIAAFLLPQLQDIDAITEDRVRSWQRYHEAFALLENQSLVQRPHIPVDCQHNGHMYYLILPSLEARTDLIMRLKELEVHTVFHYIPLHSAPAGLRYGRTAGTMTNTDRAGDCLLRLPLWVGMGSQVDRVAETVTSVLCGS
jgi:dTDP-4-amino-4,6-dideoxygalactose transaminase